LVYSGTQHTPWTHTGVWAGNELSRIRGKCLWEFSGGGEENGGQLPLYVRAKRWGDCPDHRVGLQVSKRRGYDLCHRVVNTQTHTDSF